MKTIDISYTKALINKLLQLFWITLLIVSIWMPRTVKAEIENMRFGIVNNTMLTNNIGLFYEYKVIPFLGFSLGVEYGNDFFACFPVGTDLKNISKNVQDKIVNQLKRFQIENKQVKDLTEHAKNELLKVIESDWGYYKVDFISIPLYAIIHPFAGDLCLYLGVKLDILLSTKGLCINNMDMDNRNELEKQFKDLDAAKKPLDAKEKLLNMTKDIKKEDKKLDNSTALLNSTRWSFVTGMDYTFFFGLIIGLQYRTGLTSFINYNTTKSQMFLDWNLQGSVGIDIVKIINLFN